MAMAMNATVVHARSVGISRSSRGLMESRWLLEHMGRQKTTAPYSIPTVVLRSYSPTAARIATASMAGIVPANAKRRATCLDCCGRGVVSTAPAAASTRNYGSPRCALAATAAEQAQLNNMYRLPDDPAMPHCSAG